MSEIQRIRLSSLKDICRCCHSDGNFKSLKDPYKLRGKIEVYFKMLIETFGLLISPPALEASYTICDDCIKKLRDSTKFKNQVKACEEKFNQYLQLIEKPVVKKNKNKKQYFENIDDKNNVNDYDDVENVYNELRNKNVIVVNVKDRLSKGYKEQDFDDEESDLNNIEFENVDETGKIDDEVKNVNGDFNKTTNNRENVVGIDDLLKKHSTNAKNTIRCILCPKMFVSKKLLKIHIKEHITKKYECNDCGQYFRSRTRLQIHFKNKHNKLISLEEEKSMDTDKNGVQNVKVSNYFECRFCKKRVSEYQYKRHLKTHVDEKECIYCSKIFDSVDLLKKHSEEHKYETMYTCDFCKKRFIGRSTLIRHIDLHHMGKGRKFMCHECGVFFNDITNLRAHTTTVHQKLRLYECFVCQKKLATKKTLKVHMRTHTGERPYVCDKCGEGFICFTKLKIHKIKHDVMKKYGTKYVCKICHMAFLRQSLLTHHVRSEHPGRLPTAINKYKRKYLPCPACNKLFSQKFSLDRHMAKHEDMDKVPCELCNKILVDKFALWRHMRNIHTPKVKVIREKVNCNLCKRKVYDLKKHMMVHVERPLRCETCGKNYPDEAVLHRHVMNVHQDVNKIFQCTKCDHRPYSRKEYLRIHMLKKHACDLKADKE